jgi:magnesium transporter
MSRRKSNRRLKQGLPPGSLVFTGDRHTDAAFVTLVQYNEETGEEKTAIDAIVPPDEGTYLLWHDIRGLQNVPLIEQLGKQYNIHPLALEDVLNTQQRPKLEDYEDALFVVAQALSFDEKTQEVQTEQVAIYAGEGFLVSFQEKPNDTFLTVRDRILNGNGRIRKRRSDYLLYALLDTVVDQYYAVLDKLEEVIEVQEREILDNPTDSNKTSLYKLKLEIMALRKTIYPLRDAVSALSRTDNPLVQDSTRIFIRDLYDHIVQIMDTVDNWRDLLNGLFDLYLSNLSMRMNNVMRVLTIISTIFIPLTFIVGVYGMNFDNMPELHWHYGYFIIMGFMFLLGLFLLYLFKRKRWL